MTRRFLAVIAALLSFAAAVSAQRTVTTENEFSGFRNIDVSNRFDISVVRGDRHQVKLYADELISGYVSSYVKENTLYLDVDEKAFPSDLRKALRGKNAIVPVLKAEISVKHLDTLYLHDKVVVDNAAPLFSDDSVCIVMDGSSMISNLEFKGNCLNLDMKKSASANLRAEMKSFSANMAGGAALTMKHDAGKMRITSTGSSSVRTDGTSSGVSVFSESSAELRLAGSSGSVNIVGSGKSVINADGLETGEASVKLSGPAHCIVNATGNLKVDLSGGSHLIFNGTPAIEVVRISSSSMTRPGETK